MEFDIQEKEKRWRPCIAAGKNLKIQIPITEKEMLETVRFPGEELQVSFLEV